MVGLLLIFCVRNDMHSLSDPRIQRIKAPVVLSKCEQPAVSSGKGCHSGDPLEPKATHGRSSFAQGFWPCGQSAIRFLLACPRLGKSSEAKLLECYASDWADTGCRREKNGH